MTTNVAAAACAGAPLSTEVQSACARPAKKIAENPRADFGAGCVTAASPEDGGVGDGSREDGVAVPFAGWVFVATPDYARYGGLCQYRGPLPPFPLGRAHRITWPCNVVMRADL